MRLLPLLLGAVAEEYRVGGTCVIRGCVPKKMLVYGAHFAEDLKDAQAFGWDTGDCTFDWAVLRDNVLADVDRLNGLYTQTLENHGVEKILTLRVGDEMLRATVPAQTKVAIEDEVRLAWNPEKLVYFDQASGLNLQHAG